MKSHAALNRKATCPAVTANKTVVYYIKQTSVVQQPGNFKFTIADWQDPSVLVIQLLLDVRFRAADRARCVRKQKL